MVIKSVQQSRPSGPLPLSIIWRVAAEGVSLAFVQSTEIQYGTASVGFFLQDIAYFSKAYRSDHRACGGPERFGAH